MDSLTAHLSNQAQQTTPPIVIENQQLLFARDGPVELGAAIKYSEVELHPFAHPKRRGLEAAVGHFKRR